VNPVMTNSVGSLSLGEEYPAPGEDRMIAEIVDRFHKFIKETYGHGKAHRDAHPKAHGCVKGEFSVEDDLPQHLQHGVFAEPGAKYPALIRFSSANPNPHFDDRHSDVRGMAIKLLGVAGPKLLEGEIDETTQDFLLINSNFFFSPDVEDYRDFTKDLVIPNAKSLREAIGLIKYTFELRGRGLSYLPKKFRYSYLFESMQLGMDNPLTSSYWSAVPYKLGRSQAVKYAAQSTNLPPSGPRKSPDFLRKAMADYLKSRDAIFNFMVQVQTDAEKMPVEDATIEWDQRESPFVKVATIRIPKQNSDSEERMRFAENLSYTPWHSLEDHRPLGGINRMRKAVYQAGSKLRHQMNDAPRREPTNLREVPE
jgi:hypothetical protein